MNLSNPACSSSQVGRLSGIPFPKSVSEVGSPVPTLFYSSDARPNPGTFFDLLDKLGALAQLLGSRSNPCVTSDPQDRTSFSSCTRFDVRRRGAHHCRHGHGPDGPDLFSIPQGCVSTPPPGRSSASAWAASWGGRKLAGLMLTARVRVPHGRRTPVPCGLPEQIDAPRTLATHPGGLPGRPRFLAPHACGSAPHRGGGHHRHCRQLSRGVKLHWASRAPTCYLAYINRYPRLPSIYVMGLIKSVLFGRSHRPHLLPPGLTCP